MMGADWLFAIGCVLGVGVALYLFGLFVVGLFRDAREALRMPEPPYSAADIKAIEADEEWARQEREARRWQREEQRRARR
jgi:hypothetical protein